VLWLCTFFGLDLFCNGVLIQLIETAVYLLSTSDHPCCITTVIEIIFFIERFLNSFINHPAILIFNNFLSVHAHDRNTLNTKHKDIIYCAFLIIRDMLGHNTAGTTQTAATTAPPLADDTFLATVRINRLCARVVACPAGAHQRPQSLH